MGRFLRCGGRGGSLSWDSDALRPRKPRHGASVASQVDVRPSFWLWMGSCWFLGGPRLVLPFLLAAGLHELGHLLALGALRIPFYGLELRGSGAVIRGGLAGEPREAWVMLAGPGVNLLLALLLRRSVPGFALWNLALGAWNLLPIRGLDGGQVLALTFPCWLGRPGFILCQLLHWGTLLALLLAGLWASWVLQYGLLPLALVGILLARLGMGLAKTGKA